MRKKFLLQAKLRPGTTQNFLSAFSLPKQGLLRTLHAKTIYDMEQGVTLKSRFAQYMQ